MANRARNRSSSACCATPKAGPCPLRCLPVIPATPKTVGAQIPKVVARFGGQGVTFVGDRGMIKGPQIKELGQEHFHYITAITKPQIEALGMPHMLKYL